jgi:hypothetical protein
LAGIFICYRHDDTAGFVGRLYDRLNDRFGQGRVFRDIDTLEPGADFVDQIGDAIRGCDVLLAVIGPNWLTATKENGQRRIDDPKDFVRTEIAAALDGNIRVIPILLDRVEMPSAELLPAELSALARRNAYPLSDTRWDYDVGRLVTYLEKIPSLRTASAATSRPAQGDDSEAPTASAGRGRITGALHGLAVAAPLVAFLVLLSFITTDTLGRIVLRISFFSIPVIGLMVGAAIGKLDTWLRGAAAGAAIGGLNTIVAWSLGAWWTGEGTASTQAEIAFDQIMLYFPGAVIFSGIAGAAVAYCRNWFTTRMAHGKASR